MTWGWPLADEQRVQRVPCPGQLEKVFWSTSLGCGLSAGGRELPALGWGWVGSSELGMD